MIVFLLRRLAWSALVVWVVATAVFVLYFALAEGPRFRKKFLAHAGSDPESRARAVAALDELHRDVSQYMWNRILLNAVLGLSQEGKAAAAVAALAKMMIVKARVRRDGQLAQLPAEQLVPGDVVAISKRIPCRVRK